MLCSVIPSIEGIHCTESFFLSLKEEKHILLYLR